MTTANANNTQEASSVQRTVSRRLDEVQALLAKGKGTWPQPGYVRDETWHRWQGEELALRWVMRQYGEAANVTSAGTDTSAPRS